MILSRQDRFPEALERFRRAHDLFEEVGQPVDVASTLRNIAVCHQDLNDFHASLETYDRAREYSRAHGLTLVGLEVEYNIAYLYYLRGEYSQAIRLFERARRHSREQGDPHHAALCDLDLATYSSTIATQTRFSWRSKICRARSSSSSAGAISSRRAAASAW